MPSLVQTANCFFCAKKIASGKLWRKMVIRRNESRKCPSRPFLCFFVLFVLTTSWDVILLPNFNKLFILPSNTQGTVLILGMPFYRRVGRFLMKKYFAEG
jgi:hypothetical protein